MESSDYRSLPSNVQAVLRKYFLITTSKDGEGWRVSNVGQPGAGGKPLGAGPILDPGVVDRFLQIDTTPDKAWFEWMILQSGGGRTALKRSETLFNQTKIRFIDDRVRGYRNKKTGKVYPPVSQQNAEQQWANAEQNFRETLTVGDQDLVFSHQVFGFYRQWPGKDRIYERVALAVQKFLKLTKKIVSMNKFMTAEGHEDRTVSMNPQDYDSLMDLETATRKVEQFYASKKARSDIRMAGGPNGEKTVYADDFLTVRVPLTYAASVRYGWPGWDWSNRDNFESGLSGNSQSWNDPWRRNTSDSLLVFIEFNVPMPAWVTFKSDKLARHTLHNLTLVIPFSELKNFNPDSAKLHDEENNVTSLAKIKQNIREEGARQNYDPDEEEYPLKRGPSVFANAEQAEEVVRHLDAALDAVKAWAARFDPKQVVSDYMGTKE